MPPPVKQLAGFARFDFAKLAAAVEAELARRNRGTRAPTEPFRASAYSRARVAREAGLSVDALENLRTGAHEPTIHTVVRLLLWLGDANVRPYLTYDGTAGDER